VRAAGALLWRDNDGRLEVVLVHRPRYKDWSWPKGKLDPGETPPTAAAREVEEETGLPVVLGVPLPDLRYALGDGRRKIVHYWAAQVARDEHAPALAARRAVEQASPEEIDGVVWVGAATARGLLTRRSDHAPLDALEALWRRGRLRTRAVVVARHGQARKRADWSDGEATRPLTDAGAEQAAGLVPVLAAFGIRTVVTSPWRRCLHTVRPYAKAAGLSVDRVEVLTEAAYHEDPTSAVALVREILADPEDVLVSTHRPVLPAVMDAVDQFARPWTTGTIPEKNPYLKTGQMLVVHVSTARGRPRVVALERHRPAVEAD
jgi:8-oxo-dGTP diphosphatase